MAFLEQLLGPSRHSALRTGAAAAGLIAIAAADLLIPAATPLMLYPILVLLCGTYARRLAILSAIAATALISAAGIASLFIYAALKFGDRIAVIFCIWLAALLIRPTAALVRRREASRLEPFQEGLARILREVFLNEVPLAQRMQNLTQIGAETLGVDRVGLFLARDGRLECLDLYIAATGSHIVLPDTGHSAGFSSRKSLVEDHVFAANDVLHTDLENYRDLPEGNPVRAIMAGGVLVERKVLGEATFVSLTPRQWTEQEKIFVRAFSSFVSLLFSLQAFTILDQVDEAVYATSFSGGLLYSNKVANKFADIIAEGKGDFAGGTLLPSAFALQSFNTDADHRLVEIGKREFEVDRIKVAGRIILIRARDVTERNREARTKAQLEHRLQQSEKLEAIGELASGVAHDFNNILGSVGGFAGFLLQDLPPKSDTRLFAERIATACDRGRELVEQVMDFARVRTVPHDRVELAAIVQQGEAMLSGTMPDAIDFQVRVEASDVVVTGSAVQILQMIVNLCRNARDAITDDGHIVLTVSRKKPEETSALIEKTTECDHTTFGAVIPGIEYACITVSDTGSGMTPETLSRIFEPFFTTKGRQRGTGLGLAVLHGAVLSHGGFCHVQTQPGKGTVFSLFLPSAGPGGSAVSHTNPMLDSIDGSERILIVDDQTDIADVLVIGLNRLGYSAVGVDDPVIAYEAIEEDPSAWDILVSDHAMPSMSGLDLIYRAKKIKPDLHCILCSGLTKDLDQSLEDAVGKGRADAFLQKPLNPSDIARCIRQLRQKAVAQPT